MSAFSIEALPGYRQGPFLLGIDFQYQWVGQLTSLSSAGGTNLRGIGSYLGLGANYAFSNHLTFQGAISFLGKYSFRNSSDQSQDGHLGGPLGIRLKAQYFITNEIPFSVDLNFQYFRFRSMMVDSIDTNNSGNQWMFGMGATYHFSASQETQADVTSDSPLAVTQNEPPVIPNHSIQPTVPDQTQAFKDLELALSKTVDVRKVETGLMINLRGDLNFAYGSVKPSSAARDIIIKIARETAKIFVKSPDQKIRVEGHTDSSGNKRMHLPLSQGRAESVRSLLIENGLKAESVTAQGFGKEKPVTSNGSPSGQAANRGVEIYIDEKIAE